MNINLSKLDFKTILIIILLLLTTFFGLKWYLQRDNGSKEVINQLELRLEKLEKEKKLVDKEIVLWRNKFDSLNVKSIKLEKDLYEQSEKTRLAELNANKSMQSLNKLRILIEETKKKIQDLRNNPTNRTGDDLLESIKNKTK